MKYEANIEINNELQLIEFETDLKPIEYLWQRYGMSSYIEFVNRLDEPKKNSKEEPKEEVKEEPKEDSKEEPKEEN